DPAGGVPPAGETRAEGGSCRRYRPCARSPAKYHVVASRRTVARGTGVGAALQLLDRLSRRSGGFSHGRVVHAEGLLRRPPRNLRAANGRPSALLSTEDKKESPCLSK